MRCDQWRTHRRSRAERQKWPFIPGDETSLSSEEAFGMPLRVEMSAKVDAFSKPRAERRYEVKVLQIEAKERRRDLSTRPGFVLFQKFLRILPKQIRFEIDSIARLAFAQGRDFTGVRNNPDAKT